MEDENLIYHYTSFEKLNLILKFGTLRFKESTKSNDILDTMGFINILKNMTKFKAPVDMTGFLNFILDYFQRPTYTQTYIALVSCFSSVPDSRLLWDSYTMHRPGNKKCSYGDKKYCSDTILKYNGVCIAFYKDKLRDLLSSYEGTLYDKSHIQPIYYGEGKIQILLNEWLKDAAYKYHIATQENKQKQLTIPPIQIKNDMSVEFSDDFLKPCLEFLQNVEAYSPFFKHQFWQEEKEVRASILITNSSMLKFTNISTDSDGAKYCDVPITTDCIDHIILGPEFDDDCYDAIIKHQEYKLNFSKIETKPSLGTGIIRTL